MMKPFLRLVFPLLALGISLPAQQPAAPADEPLSTSDLFPTGDEEAQLPPPGSATASTTAKPVGPVDPDLPQPIDFNVLGGIVQNSPFTRIVNVSDSLVLTGVAYVDGKPVVTLFDKDKKESLVVTDQPNLKGWTLVEASQTSDIKRASAKVNIGGEPVSIRYDASALTPESMKKDKKDKDKDGGQPPGGGDRYNRGGRGPSEEDRKKYEALSDKAKEKFRDGMRQMFSDEKFRNASEDDRRNAIRSMFDKIQKEDQKR